MMPLGPAVIDVVGAVLSAVNVAVQLVSAAIVMTPVAQAASPLQPANTDPDAGVAVRVIVAPTRKASEQRDGHAMMPGSAVTEPAPLPARIIASVPCALETSSP